MYLGSFGIDEYVGIPAATHRFSSGAAYAPTSLTYSIYEEATTTGIDEDVDMTPASPFDSITGCYWVRRQLTAAAGFEAGKNYLVVVKATVDSVAAIQMHTFQVRVPQTGDSYALANGDHGFVATKDAVDATKALLPGLALTEAAVATDAGNSATAFKTTLTESDDDYWKDALILLTSGACAKQIKKVGAYNGTTKVITLATGDTFTATPADGVTFTLINR